MATAASAGLKVIPSGSSAPAAIGIAMALYPIAHARFWRILRRVPRPMVIAVATSSGSERISTTSAVSTATSAALRVLAGHGLAELGRGGWRRGMAALDDIAESTGAADLHRERKARYKQDRESWRARLRQYQAARHRPVNERDGWWSLDDPDEYDFLACRWPVLSDVVVRGPPAAAGQETA